MSDTFAIGARAPLAGTVRAALAPAPAELLSASQTLAPEAVVPATVLERTKDGTVLLRSPLGLISIRTTQTLAPGAQVELRGGGGKPGAVSITLVETDAEAAPAPDAAAARAQRAVAALPMPEDPPAPAEVTPARANGWPALDQALASLEKAAPALASQLRAELGAASGPALAGSLLFALGTLYAGRWPGAAAARALGAAGEARLHAKLAADIAELARLAGDPATGEWQVLTLPLLSGDAVQPLRLYLRRRDRTPEAKGDGKRFVIEAELSHLGPLQLDGMVRGQRLDLVLRSHTRLADELQQEAAAIFHAVSSAQGLSGDLVFATVAQFTVAPMAPLIGHVAFSI